MRTLILDNEAVQALSQTGHDKHRSVVAHLAGVVTRRRKGAVVTVVVPTAIRVEAAWDRSDPRAASVNRFRVLDRPLDTGSANLAAGILGRTRVSVADAHIGAVAQTVAGDVVILTSDPDDMVRGSPPKSIRAVRIYDAGAPLESTHAASARRRTSATTSRRRSTSPVSKRASGPWELRSVNGDS